MRIIKSFTLILLIGIAAVGLTITPARAMIVDWDNAFALQTSGGPVNPLVLVGFNPQPEPPFAQATVLDLRNLLAPTLTTADVTDQSFRILFAMSAPVFSFSLLGDPNASGFSVAAADAAGRDLFHIMFGLTNSSGGLFDFASIVGFNPQPEPPLADSVGVGFDVFFDSNSSATLTLQIQDAQNPNNFLSFAPTVIPLPAALPLFLTGLAGLALIRRRRRQA